MRRPLASAPHRCWPSSRYAHRRTNRRTATPRRPSSTYQVSARTHLQTFINTANRKGGAQDVRPTGPTGRTDSVGRVGQTGTELRAVHLSPAQDVSDVPIGMVVGEQRRCQIVRGTMDAQEFRRRGERIVGLERVAARRREDGPVGRLRLDQADDARPEPAMPTDGSSTAAGASGEADRNERRHVQ